MPQPNMYVHFDAPAPGGVLTFASKPLPFVFAITHVSRDLATMQFIGASGLVHVDVQPWWKASPWWCSLFDGS